MRVDPDYILLAASIASASIIGVLLATDSVAIATENALIAQLAVFAVCSIITRRPALKAFHGIGVGEMGLGYIGFKVAPEAVGSLRFCPSCEQVAAVTPLSIAISAAYVIMICCQAVLIVKSILKP